MFNIQACAMEGDESSIITDYILKVNYYNFFIFYLNLGQALKKMWHGTDIRAGCM